MCSSGRFVVMGMAGVLGEAAVMNSLLPSLQVLVRKSTVMETVEVMVAVTPFFLL